MRFNLLDDLAWGERALYVVLLRELAKDLPSARRQVALLMAEFIELRDMRRPGLTPR